MEKKSKFQGHCIAITSKDDVGHLISKLVDKKLAKASHPAIMAWKVDDLQQGSSDCGEARSGKYLVELLVKLKMSGILVAVTRWYGGVPLGPARFRKIGEAALDALKEGNFIKR